MLQCYKGSTKVRALLQITLSSTPFVDPPLRCAGTIANMDQMTMRRTSQWLQMTCTTRNGSSMQKANSFQMERATQDHAYPRGCEDRSNEGGANVLLL